MVLLRTSRNLHTAPLLLAKTTIPLVTLTLASFASWWGIALAGFLSDFCDDRPDTNSI